MSPEEQKEAILAELGTVIDPEMHYDIVSLGLIRKITLYDLEEIDDRDVIISMTLTTPACPYGPQIIHAVKIAASRIENVNKVEVEVGWTPPWGPDDIAEEIRLELGFDI